MYSLDREATIDYFLKNPNVTVLIVGAGVNGIGTFRDLALQGVDVLIVDRGDYCSGASAASSHMVHGGIRYLENGEFRLVREAVRERNRLIENTPHLVKPLPTVFPIFKWFSGLLNAPFKFLGLLDKPSERGAVVIKIGMSFYDMFTREQQTVPGHVFAGRRKSLQKFPKMNKKVQFTGTYYDAAMPSPERICIELLQDTLKASDKAYAANYVKADRVEGKRVVLVDELTSEQFSVIPDVVINASGPWIDFTNYYLGTQTMFIGGTKGSHLVLDHPELRNEIKGHEIFFENKDGRIVLIFPLADKVMIGSTDIRVDDPDSVRCTEEEIDYFFEMVAHIFPEIKLDRSQIVYQFSGVRPLPYAPESFTGQISRDHKLEYLPPSENAQFPIYSMIGGKWTSFRAFSEQTTDVILEKLGYERKLDTKDLKIGGSNRLPDEQKELEMYLARLVDETGAPESLVSRYVERYGTAAEEFLKQEAVVSPTGYWSLEEYSPEEIAYIAKNEDVLHLDDLILRRTMIGKLGLLTMDALEELAAVAAQAIGWAAEFKQDEITRTLEILKDQHGVVL
ncbi:MAG: glycerol-3-phosphate dehydrogenase/oxidase [Anaerolineales bacterium]|nr:glycerol-3-phosphate dehydrogenase/oxidase [Anaerolineales bacterium]